MDISQRERGSTSAISLHQVRPTRSGAAAPLRALLALAVTVLVLWFLGPEVLLIFAAGLFAVFLAVPAGWLRERTRIPYGLCLALVLVLLAAAAAGTGYALAPPIAAQAQQVETALPQDFQRVLQDVRGSLAGHVAMGQLSDLGGKLGAAIAGPVLSSISSLAGALGSTLFVAFLGIYLAAAPRLYEKGLLLLVPEERTARAREIIEAAASTLKYFLAGRLLSMAVIASCSALGLWAIGVPAPIALALLAGILSFVPYVGSIASGVPPFLLAYAASPVTGLYVIALYVAIHLLDGYILVPLVQRRMVHLAPAVTLVAQLVLGILWGILGIAVATPLAAALMTLVRMAYVEDVLHKR